MPDVHSVTFAKNRFNGLWRAVCSCGWSHVGDVQIVQSRAAVHDLDADVATAEPAKVPV